MASIHVTAQYSEQDLIEEANALFDEGAFAEAMPLYSQLLSLNPTNPVFNYKYGATALYGDAEKKEEAVKYLKFSVGKPNVDDQSWYYLGRAYHLNYRFQDAISAYEKYKSLASNSDLEEKEVDLKISMARSGQNLLSQIKEIKVLDKKQSPEESFFRIYDLTDIGGKILVTPEELLSSEDKKRNHKSLIHFRGSGTTIYFSSYGKSGKTGLDIYHADVLPDGTYTDPVAIQGPINTPYDEDFPYLHPDDKTFYFSSKGHGSMGGYDVYKSGFDQGNGIFSEPVNLDFAVNTPDDDLFYLADSLNEMAYFASARSSKQGQLDVYKVLVKSAPLDITLIKGTFINRIDPVKKLAKITTIDATTNKEVEVQYTDPSTGEYVLSFPKGGKYKFLVEEKSSDKIHAGLVDVPTSAGVNAFLQEMELISSGGVEKLLINNLFDQTYDGDVMALAQKMLRQRAALDVNFNPEGIPETGDEPTIEKNPALAYSDAGFGAGMTNEKILEEAEARVEELKNRQILTAQLAEGAARQSDQYFENAQEERLKADSMITEANSVQSTERGLPMYKAGLAKLEAEAALRKANNSKKLKNDLYEKSTIAKREYESEKARVDSLREAIDADDYDEIYAGLVAEREKRESIDRVEDRFDPVQDIRRRGLKSDTEAQKLLERAQKIRDQEEQLSASLVTKRTQSTKMKGKDLKRVKEEIAVLESDIESAKRQTERAFKQAEDAQILADNEVQEFEILQEIADANDLAEIISGEEPTVSWSGSEQKLLTENLSDLSIDNEAIASYTAQHPEVFEEMGSEAMAMNFRRTYGAAADPSEDVALNEPTEERTTRVEQDGTHAEQDDEEALAQAESEIATQPEEEIFVDPESPEPSLVTNEENTNLSPDSGEPTANEISDLSTSASSELQEIETVPIDFDENLPVEKRIEAEEIKIQAAQDWIAIIDESIEQLENGAGGEEGAEEQLAEYRKLRRQKTYEIGQRQKLINDWNKEEGEVPFTAAIERAQADVDTLSPSLVARLESKISDYSVEISSIRSVSAIDRDYLPALAEIEISGVSAPELAEKRMKLNQSLIADIDQILNEGIDTDVSLEELVEMRRVKTLELLQDEEIMEGKAEFLPRSSEAQSYAELLKEDVAEQAPVLNEPESNYTELSPALATSLENDYTEESILPDYTALLEEAELTTNPEVAMLQRIKVKEDFLSQLQSEISIYKAAIEAAENPDPKLVKRYGSLLQERSRMIDEVNGDKASLEITQEELSTDKKEILSADSLIAALSPRAIGGNEDSGRKFQSAEIENANKLVAEQISEYVAILDDPQAEEDRNEVQIEIQKLQAFQEKLSEAAKLQLDGEADEEILAETSAVLKSPQESATADSTETRSNELIATEDNAGSDISRESDQVASDVLNQEQSETAENLESTEANLALDQRSEYEEILSISEGFVFDFDQQSSAVLNETSADESTLQELADLNESFVASIESKIDSLEVLKSKVGDGEFQKVVDEEITELMALSADKQQESDRLLAEAELMTIDQSEEPSGNGESRISGTDSAEILPEIEIPDLSSIQYKSLNASIIRNGLKSKSDTLSLLKREYASLSAGAERKAISAKMERISKEIDDGLNQSNFAEIQYYQNENERILSQLDPNKSKNREEIIALQAREKNLEAQMPSIELSEGFDDQKKLIEELAEVNKSLSTFIEPETETDNSIILGDVTAALLKPESHETASNKSYITELQSITVTNMPSEKRAALIEKDESLQTDLDFSASTSTAAKKALIATGTRVDPIGLDLLSETPDQLNYLVTMIRADSLKRLEQDKAAYAELKQSQAIEQSSEADRLLKMLPNQETDQDRESVRTRAKKLEQEAEVLYDTSALAAEQAEEIRALRSENDQALVVLSTDLSFKQRRALDGLLLKPGYRIISPEESIEEEGAEAVDEAVSDEPNEENVTPAVETAVVTEPDSESATEGEISGLAEIKGNWLGMVEIIAEKEDFSDVEKSMFVAAETSIYDASKPIPVDPVMPGGLIFQVQVGAYRNPIPQDLFGPYAPIMGQKLDNGITRYRAGLFKKYNEAIQARNEIRAKGYTDAFVVVYVDGEKLTGEQARDILAQAREKETVNIDLISGVQSKELLAAEVDVVDNTPALNTEYYSDPEAAEAAQVEVITGLFYTVQVGVYSKPVKLDQLYNLTELNSELTSSGVIRYTTGRFGNLTTAEARKELAIDKGVTDAFITAYYNGKRISLTEAQDLLKSNGDNVVADQVIDKEENKAEPAQEESENITYVVIMGTFVDDVPQELADLFLENRSWGIRKIQGPGTGAIYLSEDMSSLKEARQLLEECKKLNINTAAIGTMKDGKITSVQNE